MGEKLKIFGVSFGVFIVLLALIFVLGLISLGYYKFFEPKKENIRRQVFEQTQSYVHGKIQDLAKYQDEYNNANTNDREAIRQLIILRFAEFDETKIKAVGLRNFLKNIRGY